MLIPSWAGWKQLRSRCFRSAHENSVLRTQTPVVANSLPAEFVAITGGEKLTLIRKHGMRAAIHHGNRTFACYRGIPPGKPLSVKLYRPLPRHHGKRPLPEAAEEHPSNARTTRIMLGYTMRRVKSGCLQTARSCVSGCNTTKSCLNRHRALKQDCVCAQEQKVKQPYLRMPSLNS